MPTSSCVDLKLPGAANKLVNKALAREIIFGVKNRHCLCIPREGVVFQCDAFLAHIVHQVHCVHPHACVLSTRRPFNSDECLLPGNPLYQGGISNHVSVCVAGIVRLLRLIVSVTHTVLACTLSTPSRRLRAQSPAGLARVMQFTPHRATTSFQHHSYSPRGPEQPATLCYSAQTNNTASIRDIQQQWRQSTLERAMQATSFIGTRCPGCKPRYACTLGA